MQPLQHQLPALAALLQRQLFFVGGAPRSGTTWLQTLLDAHPDVCCRGEGLFMQQLAAPLDSLMAKRREVIAEKNQRIFAHASGYPLPEADDADALLGLGVLLALHRQCGDAAPSAVGEKTPENVFFFERLKRIFPGAKFIAIARDPRDVLASAWRFFPRPAPLDEDAAKFDFIRLALPSLVAGTQATLDFARANERDLVVVTYEALVARPNAVATRLFEFLGVAADEACVRSCVDKSSFVAMTKGRAPGETLDGSFFRKGIAGGWRDTLTEEMSDLVIKELGFAFATFGWRP